MVKKNSTDKAKKRKLIFIRHSKAEDQLPDISDFERSLTVKGKVNSRLMAKILKARGEEPGRVISSPAFRAMETALIFCQEYKISPSKIMIAPELYLDLSEEEFLPFIRKQDDSDLTVTLFGHNPIITDMAAFFAADEPEALPKTGIYCLEFEAGSWSEVVAESGRTLYFLTPRELA